MWLFPFFLKKVNDVSVPAEALPMAEYPEKLRGSRSHLDDESTNYDKPPYDYSPQWVHRPEQTHKFRCLHETFYRLVVKPAALDPLGWSRNKFVAYLHIRPLLSDIIIISELCSCPPDEYWSSIHSLSVLFVFFTTSWGKNLAIKLLNAPLCRVFRGFLDLLSGEKIGLLQL